MKDQVFEDCRGLTYRDYWRAFFASWLRDWDTKYIKLDFLEVYPAGHWLWDNIADYFTHK